jgi:site-specific recombinase XerD
MAEYEERIIIEKPKGRSATSGERSTESYALLQDDWLWSLRAANRTKSTLDSYIETTRFFLQFLRAKGMPADVHAITREHIESYMVHLLTEPNPRTRKPVMPATAHKRYRALQQFFKWLVEQGEIKKSPMERMKPPMLPEQQPSIPTEADVKALLKACDGRDFYARRDVALVRTLMDTGMRVSELVGMKLQDVDWEQGAIVVLGKGRKIRSCPFGNKTGSALKSYLRVRAMHRGAQQSDMFWMGRVKPLTRSGVLQVLQNRGKAAGLGEKLHPHQFRNFFAKTWLKQGGTETGLMRLAGWKSSVMVRRYTASAQDELARDEHQRLRPGDSY